MFFFFPKTPFQMYDNKITPEVRTPSFLFHLNRHLLLLVYGPSHDESTNVRISTVSTNEPVYPVKTSPVDFSNRLGNLISPPSVLLNRLLKNIRGQGGIDYKKEVPELVWFEETRRQLQSNVWSTPQRSNLGPSPPLSVSKTHSTIKYEPVP